MISERDLFRRIACGVISAMNENSEWCLLRLHLGFMMALLGNGESFSDSSAMGMLFSADRNFNSEECEKLGVGFVKSSYNSNGVLLEKLEFGICDNLFLLTGGKALVEIARSKAKTVLTTLMFVIILASTSYHHMRNRL
jgi:hypothetical protein